MTFADGTIVRATEDVSDEIDGVGVTLPAGDYRALPLPSAADDHRLLLLATGHEGAHPIGEDTLRTLVDDVRQPIEIID